MSSAAAFNRELGLRINREVWNEGRLEKLADYFAAEFIADRSPYGVIRGLDELRASVERSRTAFDGFREEVKVVVADDDHVVVHFTIQGRHTGYWGPLAPTGRDVEFDESGRVLCLPTMPQTSGYRLGAKVSCWRVSDGTPRSRLVRRLPRLR